MTYDELLDKFADTFPLAEIDDYRPACSIYQEGKVGITIWLKNGDMVVYYPRQKVRKNKR